MTAKEQIEQLKLAIGALAECTALFRSELISNGIAERDATQLCGAFVRGMVSQSKAKDDE